MTSPTARPMVAHVLFVALAFLYLGMLSRAGADGVPKNGAKALEYFHRACDTECYPNSCFMLNVMYLSGMNVSIFCCIPIPICLRKKQRNKQVNKQTQTRPI